MNMLVDHAECQAGVLSKTVGSGTLQNNFIERNISRGWQGPKIIVEHVSLSIYDHGSRDPVPKIISCEWTISLQNISKIILDPPYKAGVILSRALSVLLI